MQALATILITFSLTVYDSFPYFWMYICGIYSCCTLSFFRSFSQKLSNRTSFELSSAIQIYNTAHRTIHRNANPLFSSSQQLNTPIRSIKTQRFGSIPRNEINHPPYFKFRITPSSSRYITAHFQTHPLQMHFCVFQRPWFNFCNHRQHEYNLSHNKHAPRTLRSPPQNRLRQILLRLQSKTPARPPPARPQKDRPLQNDPQIKTERPQRSQVTQLHPPPQRHLPRRSLLRPLHQFPLVRPHPYSLVMELAEEGDLHDQLAHRQTHKLPFKEEEIWNIFAQITNGLEFLHAHNVLHRDIKAKNILIFKDGIAKIADLNVSTITNGLSQTRTGTLNYASPEVLMGKPYNGKTDIWSLGCLIYELICLRKPFEGENIEEIYKKIHRGQYAKMGEQYSKQLRDLVSFMLQFNPKVRPSAQTIRKMIFKSPWNTTLPATDYTQKSFTPVGLDNMELIIEGWDQDMSENNLKKNTRGQDLFVQKKWDSVRKQRPRQLRPIPSTMKIIQTKDTLSIHTTKYNTKTGASRQSNRLFSQNNEQNIINLPRSKQTPLQLIKQPSFCSISQKGKQKHVNVLRRVTVKRRNTQL